LRDGLVVGEGAGAVMLEEYEFAKKRGANILGEVMGFTCNNNGGDLILPNLKGITNTLKLGLENAKINPQDVDLISAHATATKMGDIIEAQAISDVFGDNPYVVGLKSYTGHTMAACGAIEAIMSLYMMQEGFIAPTLNLEEVDERCAMLKHVQKILQQPVKTAAIQNFAFGGVNTILLIRKFS
jgi:3-oxoacyl-[acyl-carrier-protein] synthase II